MNRTTFTIISTIAVIAAVSAYVFTLPIPTNNTQDDGLHTFNNDKNEEGANEIDNTSNKDAHQTVLARDKSDEFSLDFSLGGSIFGSTFTVSISDSTVLYQEFEHLTVEKEKFERTLSSEEIAEIKDTVTQLGILTLERGRGEAVPDEGSYIAAVSFNGRENRVGCGIPNPEERRNECQEKLETLRDTLNDVLGVNMH